MRPPLDDGVVLITGASSGIGREFARQLALRAKTLVLVARRTDRLEQLRTELTALKPSLKVHLESCDLGVHQAREAMLESVQKAVGNVDVLINNAGLGDIGIFDRMEWSKMSAMLSVNVEALAHLTHALVGGMVARGRGGILNIGSGFGLTFLPGFTGYVATKYFVAGFSESLRLDLVGTGVVVTQVCPGPVATEFEQNAGNPTEFKVPGFVEIDAARCARESLAGFSRGRALVIPGLAIKGLMWLAAVTPNFVLRFVYGFAAKYLRRRQINQPSAKPAS